MERFLINQSILSSGFYDVFPFTPAIPYIEMAAGMKKEDVDSLRLFLFPFRTKEKWNYDNFRTSINWEFKSNKFLWKTYIPIITFFKVSFKENLSLLNFSTVFSEAGFEGNDPNTGYFDPKLLIGYRIINDKDNSWNLYVGGEYYNMGINSQKCQEIILSSQKVLFLNCNFFDLSFNSAGILLVTEYERWFKNLTLEVQLGLRQLSGNFLFKRNLDNRYDFSLTSSNKSLYDLEGYFYSFRLNFGIIFVEYTHNNLSIRSRKVQNWEIFYSSPQISSYINNFFKIENGIIGVTDPLQTNIDILYADLFNSKKNFEDLGIISLGFKGRY